MHPRQLRNTLMITGTALLAIGLTVLGFTIFQEPTTPTSITTNEHTQRSRASHTSHPLPTLTELKQAWDLPLRRPLYDPPPPIVEEAVFVPPPLPVTLTGIIDEPGQSLAMLKHTDGRLLFCPIGYQLGEMEVVDIQAQHVELRYYKQPVTLTLNAEDEG